MSDAREQQWEEGFAQLRAYSNANNDTLVPQSFEAEDGHRLGKWVSVQRTKKATLSPERRRRLDELGFVWDVREQKWEEGFTHLRSYRESNSNCLVPFDFNTEDGYRLGAWINIQRTKKATMSPERRRRLDELGFVWDVREQKWEEGFTHLRSYRESNSNCLVPFDFNTEDGYRLGAWINIQRVKKDTLSDVRRRRLHKLGFVWDVRELQWEEGFAHLLRYRETNNDCLVPQSFKTEDGYRLGQWVSVQRTKKDTLSDVRRHRLDELGFVWDVREQHWEAGFTHLQSYRETNNDCLVPQSFKTEDGYRLGPWVSEQRTKKDTLSRERRHRLDELGFVRDPLKQQWEEGYGQLVDYKQREGHCQVPQSFRTADGYRLGSWVSTQRTNKNTLSPDRRHRLDELGFVWTAKSRPR